MPVFVVENLAVSLRVSNGSRGTLVNVTYELRGGKRYALSADVDLPDYTSSDPSSPHPHRLTITPFTKSIQYRINGAKKLYHATRQQLPLIGAFGFTAHNSQSRSLNAAAIHLDSSRSIACSYVMLSRIKCGLEDPKGLAILGDIKPGKILNHAPAEVREEEKRLRRLAKKTLAAAKVTLRWYTDLTGESLD
jgi:hypothetical protein